jgi:hypothetical protein
MMAGGQSRTSPPVMPAKAGIHALQAGHAPGFFSRDVSKELLFFEKKRSKKNFAPAGVGTTGANARRTKSFLLLFFKKEALRSNNTP